MELLLDPTVLSIIGLIVIFLLEKLTKKDIDVNGETKIRGIVTRVITFLVTKLKKK